MITSITLGYDGSMMNALNILPSYTDYFSLDTATLALNTASVWVGGCISGFFAGQLTDWVGRRPALLWAALLTIVGVILQSAAQNIAMFIAGRIIIGIGTGVSAVAAPTYLSETTPIEWRAFSLGIFYDFWYVGGLVSAGVTFGTANILNTWAWRAPSVLQALPSFFCIAILPFIPESPRWLAYRNRQDEALEVLAVSHAWGDKQDPIVLTEFAEIVETIRYEKSTGATVSPLETLRTKGNRYRLLLALSVAVIQATTGNNIISFYLGTMLDQAGISNSTQQLQVNIVLSAWCLVLSLIGTAYAERLGRKWLAIISTALCVIFIFLVGAFTKLYGTSTNQSGIYATTAMIFLFQGSYSFGWTPLTVMYPPEVLNYTTRAIGMGMYTFLANGMGLMVTMAFPFALAAIGWETYMINGSFDVLLLLFVIFVWVETKGKSLEEIDVIFDGVKHADVPDVMDVKRGTVGPKQVQEQVQHDLQSKGIYTLETGEV